MSIVLPPWYFNNITTSITGTPSTIQPTGASVTPGNSNADGTDEFLPKESFNHPIWCDVPSGTTWQARGTCSGTIDILDVAIYGVY